MKTNILFVCLGNICRSPAADGIMHHIVEERGLSGRIGIDSAGTYTRGTRANCPTPACAAPPHGGVTTSATAPGRSGRRISTGST